MKIPAEKRKRLLDLGKSMGMTKITLSLKKDHMIKMRGFVKELNAWVSIGGEREV